MKRVFVFAVFLTIAGAYGAARHGERRQEERGQENRPGVTGVVRYGFKPARLAVPEFVVERGDAKAAALAETFNRVLWEDLDYAGPLLLANRALYPSGRFGNAADIKSEDWAKTGIEAEYIAFGTLRVNGNVLSVSAQLHVVKNNDRIFGNQFTSRDLSERTVRDTAHHFADEILERMGFKKGIAQTEIAFVCDRAGTRVKEICVMSYDGYDVSPVTAIGSTALTPAWSVDSKKIAYLSFREGTNIEIVSRADLRRQAFPQLSGMNTTPSWSKNGKIAFASSSRERFGGIHILVADEDGKNIRQLTASDRTDVSPVWNPQTGSEIVFVSDRSPNKEGAMQLYIMDADGTNVRPLGKEGGASYNPAWSPDGLTIAFAWQKSGSGNNRDIWVLDRKSGIMAQLTANQGDNERPTWAPDGRHLAFASNRSGSWQIYSMLADGLKVRALTRGGTNEGPAWSGYMR